MTTEDVLMTKTGHQALERELERLIKVEREQVKSALAEARAHGDLKENAEYAAAKEKQSHLEGRIKELQGKLARAKVIDVQEIQTARIVFGSTVILLDLQKEKEVTYQIVGNDESDPRQGKISYQGPLGQALLGKEEGDVITVKAPKGDVEYEIQSIQYI